MKTLSAAIKGNDIRWTRPPDGNDNGRNYWLPSERIVLSNSDDYVYNLVIEHYEDGEIKYLIQGIDNTYPGLPSLDYINEIAIGHMVSSDALVKFLRNEHEILDKENIKNIDKLFFELQLVIMI